VNSAEMHLNALCWRCSFNCYKGLYHWSCD